MYKSTPIKKYADAKMASESCFIEDQQGRPSPKRALTLRLGRRPASFYPLTLSPYSQLDQDPAKPHLFLALLHPSSPSGCVQQHPDTLRGRKQRIWNHSWTPKHISQWSCTWSLLWGHWELSTSHTLLSHRLLEIQNDKWGFLGFLAGL